MVKTKTESIWTYVFLEKEQFYNKIYNKLSTNCTIEKICCTSPMSMIDWKEYHFKWTYKSYKQ